MCSANLQDVLKSLGFGATGSIGRKVVQRTLQDGHQVTAFARRPEPHELTILMESLPALMQLHGGNPNSAGRWQDLCHGLFSMNDFIYLQ